jgi:hypothetical protein
MDCVSSIGKTPHCHKHGLSVKYRNDRHSAQSYDNEVSFLFLIHSPFLWLWSVIPILDTSSILMTMRCLSYTWHSAQSYNNGGVIPILDTQPQSYDNEVTFLYLTLSPVLWQWGVIPILDTQPSLMTMRCLFYSWYTVHSYDYEVSFLYLIHSPFLWQWSVIPMLGWVSSIGMTPHSYKTECQV